MARPTTAEFLSALFAHRPLDELINVRIISPSGSVRTLFTESVQRTLEISAEAAPAANVYFGVNARAGRDDSKSGVRHCYAIFGDFDCPKNLAAEPAARSEWKRAALTRLHDLPLPPSAIVDSGGGFQAYWFLVRPLPLPESSDPYRGAEVTRAERPLKGLVRLGADKAAAELARVLRLPDTLNHKSVYPDGPLPVVMVELHPARRYAFEDLLAAFPAPQHDAPHSFTPPPSPLPEDQDDAAILKVAFGAVNGRAIRALWDGDISGHGGDDSAADQALLNHLAFYTHRDAPRMERMFTQSALGTRAKWVNRQDYRDRTIQTAIDGCRDTYTPPSPRIVLNGRRTNHPPLADVAQNDPSAAPAEEGGISLRFRTAREVGECTAAVVEWIAEPWIAKGAITEIDGKIKASGKTTFLTHLCRAVVHGDPFMGEPTRQGPVVYLSEQPLASLRQALARAGLLERDDFHVLCWADTAGVPWPDVVAAAAAKCHAVGAELLAVDTLPQFAGVRGDAENNAGAALEAMAPLQAVVSDGAIGAVCTRHERKAGGEVGDSARGSSAFGGAVDIVLQIKRPEGNARATQRLINGLSRFDGTPDSLMIELTDAGYVSLGSESAVAVPEARAALFAGAPSTEAEAKTITEIVGELRGARRTATYEAARMLVEAGDLQRRGKGKKGDPHRYWRPRPHDDVSDGNYSSADSSALKRGVQDESFSPQEFGETSTLVRAVEAFGRGATPTENRAPQRAKQAPALSGNDSSATTTPRAETSGRIHVPAVEAPEEPVVRVRI